MTDLSWVWWNWNVFSDLKTMFQFQFMVNLFEAGAIVSVLAGVVSYLVVLRRSSFASHALAHTGFSGAAGAVLFGIAPIYGLLAATLSSGLGIALLGRRAAHRDVEIGTILAFMLGVGLLFLSFYHGFAGEAYAILFGQVVGISDAQVLLCLEMTLGVLAVLALVYRPLLFASLDEQVAEAKGLPTLGLGLVFMVALAVSISIAVTIIGVLLIFALTVTPAAIAIRVAKRPFNAILIAIAVALFSTWTGAFIAFYEIEPTSFFIVTIVFLIYLAVRAAPLAAGLAARLGSGAPRASALGGPPPFSLPAARALEGVDPSPHPEATDAPP